MVAVPALAARRNRKKCRCRKAYLNTTNILVCSYINPYCWNKDYDSNDDEEAVDTEEQVKITGRVFHKGSQAITINTNLSSIRHLQATTHHNPHDTIKGPTQSRSSSSSSFLSRSVGVSKCALIKKLSTLFSSNISATAISSIFAFTISGRNTRRSRRGCLLCFLYRKCYKISFI